MPGDGELIAGDNALYNRARQPAMKERSAHVGFGVARRVAKCSFRSYEKEHPLITPLRVDRFGQRRTAPDKTGQRTKTCP